MRPQITPAILFISLVATLALPGRGAHAQTPTGLSDIVEKLTQPAPAEKPATIDAKTPAKSPDAAITDSPTPIDVDNKLDERKVAEFLKETLNKYPGVHYVEAEVHGSVVTLTGRVSTEAVRDRMREVALKVDGVVFVINRVTTDAQNLSAHEILLRQLYLYGDIIQKRWLLFLFAIVLIVSSFWLARLFSDHSETLLAPLVSNALLRSVLGSLIGLIIVLIGTFLALQTLGIAEVVLSVLGLAGVAALAIGFAFRDIAENFIASILLGFRRPFRVGDFVKVAGQSGIVRSLNTRATVLMTLEGHLVRIPNSMIFKEIVVNTTAAPQTRATFDILIPHDASVSKAQAAIADALAKHDSLAENPAPRALVEEIAREGVRLRVTYWVPTKGIDGSKVNSDARLLAKVALQQAQIHLTPDPYSVRISAPAELPIRIERADVARDPTGDSPLSSANTYGNGHKPSPQPPRPTAAPAPEARQARAAMLRDTRAVELAAGRPTDDESMQHVLDLAEEALPEEGENLLKRKDDEKTDVSPKPTKRSGEETAAASNHVADASTSDSTA